MASASGDDKAIPYPHSLSSRYAPTRFIGRGGMGSVYEAMDRQLGRLVAVKLTDPRLTRGDDLARFVREGRLLATLSHPRVVRVLDAGQLDGTPYLVMEFLEGRVLQRGMIAMRGRRLEVAQLLDAMLEALEYIHARGIVHRDIKPGNVIVHPQRGPVLVDFGLACATEPTTLLTCAGTVVGTASYMAPEMVMGQDATVRADLFATGLIGIETLTGIDVHETRGVDSQRITSTILSSLMSGTYHTTAAAALRAQGRMGAVLLRAISPDPADRFESAALMRQALTATRSESLVARPAPRGQPGGGTVPMEPVHRRPAQPSATVRTLAPSGALLSILGALMILILPRLLPGLPALALRSLSPTRASPSGQGAKAAGATPGAGSRWGVSHPTTPSASTTGKSVRVATATWAAAGTSGAAGSTGAGGAPAAAGTSSAAADPIARYVSQIQAIEPGHQPGERALRTEQALQVLRQLARDDVLPAPMRDPGSIWTRPDQDRYERRVWRYELSVMAHRSVVERETCRHLFPASLRPGEVPPASGRVFREAVGGGTLKVSDALETLFHVEDHMGFLRKAYVHVDIKDIGRARNAWVVLRSGPVDPDVVVWATCLHDRVVQPGAQHAVTLGLVVPGAESASLVCHSVPPVFLHEGRCEFKLEMDTLARGERSIRGLDSFEVILAP